jgi:hypothetical protein
MKEYSKQYYKDHKAKILKSTTVWAKNNPERKKEIARDNDLKKKGWTQKRYDSVLKEQHNLCAICKQSVEGVLDADHKHSVPPVPRGLLCHLCNLGLGVFKDDPVNLEAAIEYLRKYSDATQENN